MADAKRTPEGGTGLEAITGLLNLFGKDQRVTGTADTSALKDLLARITAPQDTNAQLESIFQQAAGAIPKFQAAFGNAVGARSGGNSAVNAALQNLLQQTTLAGQKQIAEQQLQRDQIAANAAGSLASATRGTVTKERPNLSGAGKALGILQIGSKLGLTDKLKQGVLGTAGGGITGAGAGGLTTADLPSFLPSFGATPFLADAGGGGIDLSSAFSATPFDFSLAEDAAGNIFSTAAGYANDGFSLAGGAVSDAGSGIGDFFGDIGSGIKEFFGFADGGLIGRDGEPVGKFTMVDEAAGYADGGVVKAGGGRRSSAPTYTPDVRATTGAINTVEGQFGLRPRLDRTMMELGEPGIDSGGGGTGVASSSGLGFSGPSGGPQIGLTPSQAISVAMNIANPSLMGMFSLANTISNVSAANAAANAANQDTDSSINGAIGMGPTAVSAADAALGAPGVTGGQAAAAGAAAAAAATAQGLSDAAIGAAAQAAVDAAIGIGNGGIGGGIGSGPGGADGQAGGIGSSDAGSTGAGADTGGPDGSGGDGTGSGTGGYKHGGQIRGAGTPTSDSVPIMASVNEYVVSADVVDALGVEFFDNLQKNFHNMAGVQKLPAPQHLQTMKR